MRHAIVGIVVGGGASHAESGHAVVRLAVPEHDVVAVGRIVSLLEDGPTGVLLVVREAVLDEDVAAAEEVGAGVAVVERHVVDADVRTLEELDAVSLSVAAGVIGGKTLNANVRLVLGADDARSLGVGAIDDGAGRPRPEQVNAVSEFDAAAAHGVKPCPILMTYVPAGMETTPPPAAEQASIAAWMYATSSVTPSP